MTTVGKKPRKLRKEAKIALIIGLCILLCILLAVLANLVNGGGSKTSSDIKEFNSYRDDIDYVYKSIEVQNIDKRFDNGETFVVLVGSTDDPASDELLPILNEVASGSDFKDVNFINLAEMDVTERNELTDMLMAHYSSEYSGSHVVSVPTILFVKDGNIVYSNIGTVDGHDAYYRTLTESERNELVRSLTSAFELIQGNSGADAADSKTSMEASVD